VVAAVGAVLALAGALLVVVVLLRSPSPGQPGHAEQNRTLTVVAGLVLAALGAATLAVGVLADDDDGTETAGTSSSSSSSADGAGATGAGSEATDPESSDQPSPPATRSELPACFEQHLGRDPVVQADDHVRLVEGVSVPITPTLPTALELATGDEVLGVVRVLHEPLDRFVHVYDVVDAACAPVTFTPDDVLDEVERTTRTTIPLRLEDRNYELILDGVENGHTFDAMLRHTG
jgi:hypothetical protein